MNSALIWCTGISNFVSMHWISFKNRPEDYNDKMGEGVAHDDVHDMYFLFA